MSEYPEGQLGSILDDLNPPTTGATVPETDETVQIEKVGRSELARIRRGHEVYAERKPAPQRKTLSFAHLYGPDVVGLVLSAIGSILISALRVGTIFFISEVNLATLYTQVQRANTGNDFSWLTKILSLAPVLMMLFGTFAFEGYLFARGYINGKESGQIRVSNWGVMIAFFVTISAGLLSSMALTDSTFAVLTSIVQFLVVISTGIGAPAIAYFGAENIGVIVNQYRAALQELEDDYQKREEEWQDNFQTWYSRNRDNLFGVPVAAKQQKPKKQEDEDENKEVQAEVERYLVARGLLASEVGPGQAFKIAPAAISVELGLDGTAVRTALSRLRAKGK